VISFSFFFSFSLFLSLAKRSDSQKHQNKAQSHSQIRNEDLWTIRNNLRIDRWLCCNLRFQSGNVILQWLTLWKVVSQYGFQSGNFCVELLHSLHRRSWWCGLPCQILNMLDKSRQLTLDNHNVIHSFINSSSGAISTDVFRSFVYVKNRNSERELFS
jgi:hypothetical protein